MLAKAADLYENGTLPLGDGTQSPDDFVHQQSASTGLPEHMCRLNMSKNSFVLKHMDQILDCLTRGLDLKILTRGWGVESRGVVVSYQAQTPTLAAVLPSNSPGVHTLWLPAIPLQVGLVLKPGPQEPWTPYRMMSAFVEAGVPPGSVRLVSRRCRSWCRRTLTQRENRPIYDLEVYRLADSPAVFSLPRISQPMGVNFDGLLRLDAAFVAPQARPGTWLPVAITLAPLVPLEVDYKASVRLLSATGERLLQKDRILKHNFHQGTSLWPPETVNEYYLLPVSPVTPPGDYTVALVIYHPDTQVPLIDSGVVEVPLGATHIE